MPWGSNFVFTGAVVLVQCPEHMAEAEQIIIFNNLRPMLSCEAWNL